ncbi:MAG: hypothetical protein IPL71_03640 [Anaerolineales bacterium]|uniref:hypothetical protein n=1 Tax=Candidatus Villigracilis proximus TaxID=3140683 RepID=UPI0031364FBF|nr:hypothetical protein [Anaerolineales bacterium]
MNLTDYGLSLDGETVLVENESILRANIGKLARLSALDGSEHAAQARYLIRAAAGVGHRPRFHP